MTLFTTQVQPGPPEARLQRQLPELPRRQRLGHVHDALRNQNHSVLAEVQGGQVSESAY